MIKVYYRVTGWEYVEYGNGDCFTEDVEKLFEDEGKARQFSYGVRDSRIVKVTEEEIECQKEG